MASNTLPRSMPVGWVRKNPRQQLTERQKAFKKPFRRSRTGGLLSWETAQRATHHGITHPSDDSDPSLGQQRYGTTKVCDDVVTPGYLHLINTGHIINNGFYSQSEFYDARTGTMSLIGTAPGHTDCVTTISGYLGALFDQKYGDLALGPSQLKLTQSDAHLLNKIAIDTRSRVESPKTLALVTAAEMNKTMALFGETAMKIAKLIRHARRLGTLRGAQQILGKVFREAPTRKSLDGAAKNWLAWRYGWGPTMMDINGTLEAYAYGDFVQKRKFARATAEDSRIETRLDPLWYAREGNPSLSEGEWSFAWDEEFTQTLRGYILYQADLTYQPARAFGVDAFPSTAWELLPYSFVVDWFLPVGNWISAIEPKVGVQYLMTGYTTTTSGKVMRRCSGYRNLSTDPHHWAENISLIGHVDAYERVTRSRATYLPAARFPSFDVRLNKKRVLDAIALMVADRKLLRV